MTAIIGIRAFADPKNKKIILASDSQLTEYDIEEGIEVPVTKTTGFKKIASGPYWAMGFAGVDSPHIRSFFKYLKQSSNESLIEKAVKEHRFYEVNEMNSNICCDQEYGETALISFLLAAFRPELGLFYIDIMGNVLHHPVGTDDTADYVALGSGKKFIKTFLEDKITNDAIDQDGIAPGVAIRLAYDSIEKNNDPSTGGGVELFAVGETGVINYGERLRKATRKALREELDAILEEQNK